MISAMEHEFGDAESELRQEFEAQREEVKNRNQVSPMLQAWLLQAQLWAWLLLAGRCQSCGFAMLC